MKYLVKDLAINTVEEYLSFESVKSEIEFAIKNNPGKEIHTTLIYDSGLDSATGQSDYNQLDSSGKPINYNSLLTSQFMPLQLILEVKGKRARTISKTSLYINELRHSPYSIRPLQYNYVKEDKGMLFLYYYPLNAKIRTLLGTGLNRVSCSTISRVGPKW